MTPHARLRLVPALCLGLLAASPLVRAQSAQDAQDAPRTPACRFTDDGAFANALTRSKWRLGSTMGYRIHGGTIELRRDPIAFDLEIGPLLREGAVDGIPVRFALRLEEKPDRFKVKIGRNTINLTTHSLEGSPCGTAGLSMLHATGQTELNRRRATLTLKLWPASGRRMVGLVRVERTDAFGQLDALYHPVEAILIE